MTKAFEALDRTLQDLRNNKKPMGGVTVVLSRDYRQTLPVIPQGTRADEVHTCIKNSYLWTHITRIHLSTNMRVNLYGDTTLAGFSIQLLQLGNGSISNDENGKICLPFGEAVKTEKEVITNVSQIF